MVPPRPKEVFKVFEPKMVDAGYTFAPFGGPINIKNYTAYTHDMVHIPGKFRANTSMPSSSYSVKTKHGGHRCTRGVSISSTWAVGAAGANYMKNWSVFIYNFIVSLLSPAVPKARDGRYCKPHPHPHPPPPPLSVCLSVTFSFRTGTRKRIDVFSRNFAGMCTMSWGCAV